MSYTTSDGSFAVSSYIAIDTNKTSFVAMCKNNSTGVTGCSVSSMPSTISTNTLKLIEAHSNTVKVEDKDCTASIQAGDMYFNVSGNTLTFSDPKEGNLVLTRQ